MAALGFGRRKKQAPPATSPHAGSPPAAPSREAEGPAKPRAAVEVRGCQGCGECMLACPENAIHPVARKQGPARLRVDGDLCNGCGLCVEICPVDAIDFTSNEGER